ncbi:MAG: ATP synthase subunit I [Dehalococcoidia bacterium]|nr:ATP synthase subunit I [Dehalococcoidia bacterium]
MNDQVILTLLFSLLAGALLGSVFFGGLWWTVRQSVSSANPAILFFVSLMIRTGITLAGFYALFHGDWRRLLTGLAGFTIARLIAIRLTRPAVADPSELARSTRNAS